MADKSEFLWRVVPGVRRTERERFVFFFGLSALLSLAQTLGLAGSEALFLSRLGPSALPGAFILASLTTLLGSVVYAVFVGRARNDRLYIVILCAAAVFLTLNLGVLDRVPQFALFGLFCAFFVTQAVLVSLHFWTFAADFFDTPASKRLFPLFAVGSSIGGMLGGLLAVGVTRVLSSEAVLMAWAVVLLLAATQIRLARSRLLSWAPVGAEEADESSVEGLRGALRYVARSRMAYWLVVSVVGMVFALTLMQFIYLDIFSRSFSSAEQLAAFFGLYLAITNGIEILVGNALTPWLIRRFGVAQANLAHPMLTLITFVGLAIDPRLWVAVLARVDRELLENSLAGPIRALSYNALPRRFRGRMRALLEGVIFFAAMSLAGAALLLFGADIELRWLALLGGLAALVYAFANGVVRREYIKSLVLELRQGRLDLSTVASQLNARELAGVAEHWEQTLAAKPDGPHAPSVRDLAMPLARYGFTDSVRNQLAHRDPGVRAVCLEALAATEPDDLEALSLHALDDPDAGVRQLAIGILGRSARTGDALAHALRPHTADPDPVVRADVAVLLGAEGVPVLAQMLASDDVDHVVAALERAPFGSSEDVRRRDRDDDPRIRAAALAALARHGDAAALDAERLVEELHHSDARVRRTAAAILAAGRDESATQALAQALDDVSRGVRAEAQSALARMGQAGILAAAPFVSGARIWTADAALGTIARAGGQIASALLAQAFADRVASAWRAHLALACCGEGTSVDARFLRAALHNAGARSEFLAFRVLELTQDAAVVRSVISSLESGGPRDRGDALEVLSNLGEREDAHRFALLLEEAPIEEKLKALAGYIETPADRDQVLVDAANSEDRWLRLAAARYGHGTEPTFQETEIMERLLALQSVPLFKNLSLEQLEIINRLLQEVEFLQGEVIVREGQPGNELFILEEGEVQFFKSYRTDAEQTLATMQPVGYFGEIAILDNEPRSVTAIALRTRGCSRSGALASRSSSCRPPRSPSKSSRS